MYPRSELDALTENISVKTRELPQAEQARNSISAFTVKRETSAGFPALAH